VILREGFSLTSRVEPVADLPGAPVWKVSDDDRQQAFYLCLDAGLTLETTNALGLTRDDLFICRDVALDDTEAANLALQCRLKLI
jgi:adenine-specific DNA-methyltransferase